MRRRPRPVELSPTAFHEAALDYLARYAASRDQLRRVLTRRVIRAERLGEVDREAAARAIEAALDRLTEQKLLDDQRFAESRARSLVARGRSRRAVSAALQARGVDPQAIAAALANAEYEHGASDWRAACALARRRRLGPYRLAAERKPRRDRDLAALLRAGFDMEIARRVIDAESVDALELTSRAHERDNRAR
jgi:regulatory protein